MFNKKINFQSYIVKHNKSSWDHLGSDLGSIEIIV